MNIIFAVLYVTVCTAISTVVWYLVVVTGKLTANRDIEYINSRRARRWIFGDSDPLLNFPGSDQVEREAEERGSADVRRELGFESVRRLRSCAVASAVLCVAVPAALGEIRALVYLLPVPLGATVAALTRYVNHRSLAGNEVEPDKAGKE